ncbi:MAG: tetratricopeptide repeat protein [Candidatus Thorarchaeota archaeon]
MRFLKKNDCYNKAAQMLLESRLDEAITLLRGILEKDPTDYKATVTLAVSLMELQNPPRENSAETREALELLDRAIKDRPDDPVAVFNKGVCLRKLGNLEPALECFKAALELDEKLSIALLHVAEINYELERWNEAIEYARKALTRDPGFEHSLTWVREAIRKASARQDGSDPPGV